MDKLHVKFFSIARRFPRSKSRFSRFKETAHECIKERYPVKVATKWLEIESDSLNLRTGTVLGFRAHREH